jgi:hypothetical protein
MENQDKLPDNRTGRVKQILAEMKDLMQPRKKRTRREELQETALDLIPNAMDAASEQMRISKQRKKSLGNYGLEGADVQVEDYEREVDGETRKGKLYTITGGTVKEYEFSDVKQLQAFAATLPEFNNWFLDGDGKRTCHVYDAEVAAPAVKRATYQQYNRLLEKLPDRFDGLDVASWRRRIKRTVDVLKDVEELAAARMDAFNAVDEAYKAYNEDKYDKDLRQAYKEALAVAEKASQKYMKKLHGITDIDGRSVREILTGDDMSELRQQLGTALEKIYSNKEHTERPYKHAAEDLFVKLTKYGNYAVHMQRRENAQQYKEVFEYLVQNTPEIVKKLAFELHVDEGEVLADIRSNAEFYAKSVEVVAKSAADVNDPLNMREAIFNAYKRLAHKLEKRVKADDEKVVMQPLEERESLALDALGCYNMGRIYPELFKGGYVIAEFAQPDIDVLREGSDEQIRSEVVKLARSDVLLQVAFANAMGTPGSAIIPLHEDPATMKYSPDAQAVLREEPILSYFMKQMGVANGKDAEAKALRYIDESGKPQLLTAYQNLKRLGASDQEMAKKGLDVAALKNSYVLEAPFDMEACSDNNKRSSTMGSEEAEQSIRDKTIAASRHPISLDGKQYVIVKPKYMGQGGAIARATKIALDTQQATWQGEQLSALNPKSIAHMAQNNMLGRLYLTQEAALGHTPSEKLYDISSERPIHTGNALGLPGTSITKEERELMDETIKARIASTRDDKRYNDFLVKYGEPAPNYSARPDAKGTKKETFNSGRAIGIAAKEAGIWSNVIGIAEMFDVGKRGRGKGQITNDSAQEVRQWNHKDPYIQHMLTAGALVANFVNLKEKWARGNIEYREHDGEVTLTKKGVTVPLEVLQIAYDKKQAEYKDPQSGVVFDGGDLVMAHLTEQFHRLKKGLLAVYPGKKDLLDLFDKEHQPTIIAYKELYDDILQRLRETKPGKDEPKSKDRELLEGAYYVLFESGNGIFPMDSLLERSMYERGAKDTTVTR